MFHDIYPKEQRVPSICKCKYGKAKKEAVIGRRPSCSLLCLLAKSQQEFMTMIVESDTVILLKNVV